MWNKLIQFLTRKSFGLSGANYTVDTYFEDIENVKLASKEPDDGLL